MKKNPKIIFIGTLEFGAVILRELILNKLEPVLVITSPDKPIERKQIVLPPIVKIVAEKYGIPVLQTEKILALKTKISEIKPDLIIVAAFGHLLPKLILDIPKYGCINVHPSLLPKYRGPAPVKFTILNGEKETGVTIILMTEKIDNGPIIASKKLKINNQKITSQELERDLARLGAELLIEIIPKWIENKIKAKPQDESKATYTKILKKDSGRIDWSKSAQEIERQIRAFDPWPSTFCKAGKRMLKIWKASVQEQTKNTPKGSPGKTFLAPNNKIAVQCGKDFLIIEELQFEGKKKVKVQDFLRGNIDFIGTILE